MYTCRNANITVPWLRWSVAIPSPPRCEFSTRLVYVGFVVDKVALTQLLLRVLRFSLANVIPPMLYTPLYATLMRRTSG
jgi:hypothetical protein